MWFASGMRATRGGRRDVAMQQAYSGLVDFVDVDNGERAGPARVVHPGHRIDGLANLCDRKAVTRRDHAGRSRPAIGLRIVDCVRSEHAAKIVDPTYAAQNVKLYVENGETGSRARC